MEVDSIMKADLDNRILEIVSKIRREADSANRSYEWEVKRIERRASYSIDISQMNVALEIIADSKKALDQLYTTYEALVRTLDMQCRPLADQGASAHTVKEVHRLIAYMNSESSSLSGNFTASLNSCSLGDVGGMRYVASLEAQTIERFWKTKYSMMPEAIEEEKRQRQAAAEAAKRREEQRKIEAAERAERERKAAQEAKKIEEANIKAKAHMDAITSECMKRVAEFEKSLQEEIQTRKSAIKQEIKQKISDLETEKKLHEERLAALGTFRFGEKKAEKQEIARLENRILTFKDPSLVSNATREWEDLAQSAVEGYKKKVQTYVERRFPGKIKKASSGTQSEKLKYLEDAQVAQMECPIPPTVKSVFK